MCGFGVPCASAQSPAGLRLWTDRPAALQGATAKRFLPSGPSRSAAPAPRVSRRAAGVLARRSWEASYLQACPSPCPQRDAQGHRLCLGPAWPTLEVGPRRWGPSLEESNHAPALAVGKAMVLKTSDLEPKRPS